MHFLLESSNNGVMFSALTDLAQNFLAVIPRIVGCFVLLIIGWIAANFVSKLAGKAANKVGLDKIADKLQDVDIIRKNNIMISFEKIITKVLYWTVFIFFIIAATEVLGVEQISTQVGNLFNLIPKVLFAFVMLVGGTLLANGIKGLAETTLKSLGVGSASVISTVIFFFVFINILLLALKQTGIETDFLEQNISIIIGGVVAAFALGYGLASKDVMSNFVSSLYSKELFNIGDKITIEGVTGTISEVTKSSVVVETETSTVRFPLNKAISNKIEFHK